MQMPDLTATLTILIAVLPVVFGYLLWRLSLVFATKAQCEEITERLKTAEERIIKLRIAVEHNFHEKDSP